MDTPYPLSNSPPPTSQKRDWNVYLLTNPHNSRTYLGVTNNPERRLRQHNQELKGGAKATKTSKDWQFHLLVPNLTKSEALSYERICKNKRKRSKGKTPLERRLSVIYEVIGKEKLFFYGLKDHPSVSLPLNNCV